MAGATRYRTSFRVAIFDATDDHRQGTPSGHQIQPPKVEIKIELPMCWIWLILVYNKPIYYLNPIYQT